MDLNEYALSESQRTLKRLGITHVLRTPLGPSDRTLTPSPRTEGSLQPELSAPIPAEHSTPSTAKVAVPPLLRSLFHGKHAPVRTMWTYAGLFEDMQRAEIPARLGVFKKIQDSVCVHLNWAAKDISAWPLDVSPQIFLAGLEYFRPRTVIIFRDNKGEPGIMDAEPNPFLDHADCLVIKLPNLEEMAQGNQQLKNEAWKILQTVPK